MKKWVGNHAVDALLKTLVLAVILHVVVLILANFLGTTTGLLNLKVFWPHLTGGSTNVIISLVLLVLVYLGFYSFVSKKV